MARRRISNKDFSHLHVHTEYSSFDGLNKISNLPMLARKMGFPALAITDHGTIGGAIKFMQECMKTKDKDGKEIPYPTIKPIIGCEMYLSRNRFSRTKDEQPDMRRGNRHLVLLAKNWEGYQNLCSLSQASWIEGYGFMSPRIDFDLLEKHHKGLICSSACFDENQLVSTGQGLKKIIDLSLSDSIIDKNGKLSVPSALSSRKFSGKMYQFELSGSFFSLYCTEDHKILIERGGEIIWERAENLQNGDFFLSPVLDEVEDDRNLWDTVDNFFFYARSLKGYISKPVYLTPKFCFLAGAYLAEGYVSTGGRIGWTVSIDEKHYAQEISDCCYEVFGIRPEISERKSNSRIDLTICSAEIRRLFLTYFGSKADGKFIHSVFLQSSNKCKEQLLRGAFLGDGHFKRMGKDDWYGSKFVYASISRSLLWGLWQISISLGLRPTTIAYDEKVSENGVRHRKSYYMYAYGSDAFAINLLMSGNEDWRQPIVSCDKSKKINFSSCGKYVKLLVKHSKCEIVANKTVYCLTEDRTNAFLAYGFVVHNCLSSVINSNLLNDRYDKAKIAATKFKDLFGDDFYLEVMYHGIDAEGAIIPDVKKLGEELGIKILASNDSHYGTKDMGKSHELLMAMSTSKCLHDPKHLHFPYDEFYLKSAAEMAVVFGSQPDWLLNTREVADKIDSETIYSNMNGGMRLPKFKVPKEFNSPFDYMVHLAKDGMRKLGWDKSERHVDRLTMEINDVRVALDVNNYDFPTYFLIVRDYIKEAESRGILVGAGRGSGYGSVLLRALEIAYGPDPIDLGLLWERFLGFDDIYSISERDFGFEAKKEIPVVASTDVIDEARAVEDDLGGVDRY